MHIGSKQVAESLTGHVNYADLDRRTGPLLSGVASLWVLEFDSACSR